MTGGSDLTLFEVNDAAEVIYNAVDPDANIIFGAVIDEKLQGDVMITVIATGFKDRPQKAVSFGATEARPSRVRQPVGVAAHELREREPVAVDR